MERQCSQCGTMIPEGESKCPYCAINPPEKKRMSPVLITVLIVLGVCVGCCLLLVGVCFIGPNGIFGGTH